MGQGVGREKRAGGRAKSVSVQSRRMATGGCAVRPAKRSSVTQGTRGSVRGQTEREGRCCDGRRRAWGRRRAPHLTSVRERRRTQNSRTRRSLSTSCGHATDTDTGVGEGEDGRRTGTQRRSTRTDSKRRERERAKAAQGRAGPLQLPNTPTDCSFLGSPPSLPPFCPRAPALSALCPPCVRTMKSRSCAESASKPASCPSMRSRSRLISARSVSAGGQQHGHGEEEIVLCVSEGKGREGW